MIATTTSTSHINIVGTPPGEVSVRWQSVAADAITDPAELFEILSLDPALLPAARKAAESFPLRVPRGFAARMERGNPRDPLLRQVLPIAEELEIRSGFGPDPVGDLKSRVTKGVLNKYLGRALLIATGSCAVHCRYCFRRHFPYGDETASNDRWVQALDYIRRDPSVNEVILSGGDPLNLSNRRLEELTSALIAIPHVQRLRIHTRTAVVIPERIDAGFVRWLKALPLQKVVVIHTNHAREIDDSVRSACGRIKDSGAMLLNQSVLLSGVNDSVDALADLSETLFAAGVMPYYLSLLDRVAGAAHFEIDEAAGAAFMRKLTARLPGYLVPKLVREVSGADSKTSVSLFL